MSSYVTFSKHPVSFLTSAACGAEIAGWEKHDRTFPRGEWESYFADSAANCAAACAANSDRCAASLWVDSTVWPYSDLAKCQFVTKLRGFTTDMPSGIALYTPCKGRSSNGLLSCLSLLAHSV
jgi:hypothetical protein